MILYRSFSNPVTLHQQPVETTVRLVGRGGGGGGGGGIRVSILVFSSDYLSSNPAGY